MDEDASKTLEYAFRTRGFSARSYFRIVKVSRTIADLEASETIRARHVEEALTYRPPDRAQ